MERKYEMFPLIIQGYNDEYHTFRINCNTHPFEGKFSEKIWIRKPAKITKHKNQWSSLKTILIDKHQRYKDSIFFERHKPITKSFFSKFKWGLKKNIKEWCNENLQFPVFVVIKARRNIKACHMQEQSSLVFCTENDRMLFMLRWYG